jgi:hypothetical protein
VGSSPTALTNKIRYLRKISYQPLMLLPILGPPWRAGEKAAQRERFGPYVRKSVGLLFGNDTHSVGIGLVGLGSREGPRFPDFLAPLPRWRKSRGFFLSTEAPMRAI